MKRRVFAFLLCLVLCLSLVPATAFAGDGSDDPFTMERIPGETQKDVLVDGEHRVIYCMQFDYLWPVTGEGYANPPTVYTEASEVDLLQPEQQQIIQRVLYAGYPYDSVGILAPLYTYLDAATASEAASNLTQALIWSFMADWNVPGNTHYVPTFSSTDSDIPGWDEAYNGLVDYALNGAPLATVPEGFSPAIVGETTFTKHEEAWMTGPLSITDPDGFKIMYHVTVPDDVFVLDKDGFEMFPNWDFVDGSWVDLGYTIYGGDTFYLQTEHGPSAEGLSIDAQGSVKLPSDFKQYLTNDTGLGDKNDGQGYVQHKFQTMLSVGITSKHYSASAVLHAAEETVTITGHKTWVHGDNPESQRPTSITVHLHANGVLKQSLPVQSDAMGNWTYTFPNLPKYDLNGVEIVYSVDEGYVPDYSASYHGYNITNTYLPGETSLNVEKTWNDDDDHDGFRPSFVTVRLLADGVDTGKTLVLSVLNNWSGAFEDLVEKKNGVLVQYTVEEVPVPGYSTSYEPQVDSEGRTIGVLIINTHAATHISVSGEKTWHHGDNPVADRPAIITVFLHADGVVKDSKTVTEADGWKWTFADLDKYDHGTEIVYTVSEAAVPNYVPTYDQSHYGITNTYAPEQTGVSVNKVWNDDHDRDGIRPSEVTIHLFANLQPTGKTLVLDAGNHWEGAFTGLNVFDADGNVILYSVTEDPVDGYKTVITGSETAGYTVTNTHAPEMIEVNGHKIWEDADDQDGKRPESITVHLLADGVLKDSVTVTAAEDWKWDFTDLHKYNQGAEIVYTLIEEHVEDYSTTYHDFNITNQYTPQKTSVTVEKSWQDDHDRDGLRPESIQVRLLADGVPADVPLLTLDADNNWEGSFTGLDEFNGGTRIVYTIEEVTAVDGYETVISGDAFLGFVIINIHTPEVTELSVRKVWDDEDDRDALRPEIVRINVYANGVKIDTVTLDESVDWECVITGLHKYENSQEIVYTVDEEDVEGYDASVTGNVGSGFTVVNHHTPVPRGTLTVTKTVAGDDGDTNKEFHFTVTLDDSTVNGIYGDMTFTDGVASFTLKDGESKTAEELPEGIGYTVVEDDYGAEGYVTEKIGDEGVIVGGETAKAEFTNTKNAEPDPTESSIPETGDGAPFFLWIALLIVSGAVLVSVLGSFRKRYV